MKSIEIKVPRNVIKKFYLHPEPYGEGAFVVDLVNDMYTDVFYQENGDFITLTNDYDLIAYLRKSPKKSREYFYRNGVYALRLVEECDHELIWEWKEISPIRIQLELPESPNLPSQFMVCFYWIEVGKAKVEKSRMTLEFYEHELINMRQICDVVDMVLEHTSRSKDIDDAMALTEE